MVTIVMIAVVKDADVGARAVRRPLSLLICLIGDVAQLEEYRTVTTLTQV